MPRRKKIEGEEQRKIEESPPHLEPVNLIEHPQPPKENPILIFVILLFLLGAFFVLLAVFSKGLLPEGVTNTGGSIPDLPVSHEPFILPPPKTCGDECLFLNAQSSRDASFCQNITANTTRDSCYLLFANDSLLSCLQLSSYQNRKECILYHATYHSSKEICSYLESQDYDKCLQKVAQPCTNYTDNSSRNLCMALHYTTPSYCNGEEQCILSYATQTKDTAACNLISYTVNKTACKSAVEGIDYCANLSITPQKDLCYQIYGTYTNSIHHCRKISDNDNDYAAACFTAVAIALNNADVCSNVGLFHIWNCYTAVASATANLSVCERISTFAKGSLDGCYFTYAIKNNYPSACNNVSDIYNRGSCFAITILQNQVDIDPTSCQKIYNPDWKDKCYSRAAYLRNDTSLCNYIVNYQEQNTCFEKLGIK